MSEFKGKFQEADPINRRRLYAYDSPCGSLKEIEEEETQKQKEINILFMLELQNKLDKIANMSISDLIVKENDVPF